MAIWQRVRENIDVAHSNAGLVGMMERIKYKYEYSWELSLQSYYCAVQCSV